MSTAARLVRTVRRLAAALVAASVIAGSALAQTPAPAPAATPAASPAAPAADQRTQVQVAASLQEGYGRLILTFTGRELMPEFTSKTQNGVVVLEFQARLEAQVDRLPMQLPSYVTIARRDPDGRALRFALAPGIKVNLMEAGEKLFVDFLPPSWKGLPPALPAEVVTELARRAAAALKAQRDAEARVKSNLPAPKLEFRVGRSPTFTRFSFGWNVPFDTRFVREDETVTIAFDRMGEIDLGPVKASLPPGVIAAETATTDNRLSVILAVDPHADVRGFRDGNAYVVDISVTSGPQSTAEAAIRRAASSDTTLPEGARQQVNAPGRPAPAGATSPPATTEKPVAAAPSPAPASPVPVAPAPPTPAAPAAATPAPAATPPATLSAPRVFEVPSADLAEAPTEKVEVTPEGKVVAPGALPQPSQPEGRPAVAASPDANFVRVEARRVGSTVRLVFPFREPVASAVFKRNDSVWMVFQSSLPMDTRAVRAGLGPLAQNVVTTRSGDIQTLRVDLTEPLLATLGSDGNSWIVSIGDMIMEPARPLTVERWVKPDGRLGLRVALREAGAMVELADPKVGDRIFVATAKPPARGVLKPHHLVDVSVLASAHGVAVTPHADDVTAAVTDDTMVVGRDGGLNVTRSSARGPAVLPSSRKEAVADLEPSSFDAHDPKRFNELKRTMEQAIADAPEADRRARRMDYARFLIGHRFAPEALGVLRLAAKADPSLAREPNYVLLTGAAETLAGRSAEAWKTLSATALKESPDAAVWRVIAGNALGLRAETREATPRAQAVVGGYPKDIAALFMLAAAENAVELNDFGQASAKLAELDPLALEPREAARFDLVQGRIADASGRPEDAAVLYERAIAADRGEPSAEARFRLVRLQARDGKVTNAASIAELQSMALGWRGDELEVRVLRALAQTLVKEKRWRDAFNTMKAAVIADARSETTRLLQDEMAREFASLFLDGKADQLTPVEALSLYYDFREMTPIGRLGDEMVRHLADRLITVDLLPQAAEVLQHQVDNRLRGAARSQIAADLAVVYLLDRKPDRALAVLNKTRQAELPDFLERQRRVVEARALSDLGRAELAMEILNALTGSDVDRLKSDILWKAERWREAGEAREALLGQRWTDPDPLSDQERLDVLKAAIGYSLANDPLSLDRFRTKFQAKMTDSPQAKAFEVVTSPIATQGIEFRAIARDVAALDTMRAFLDEYRALYLKSGSGVGAPEGAPKTDPKGPSAPQSAAPGAAPPGRTPERVASR